MSFVVDLCEYAWDSPSLALWWCNGRKLDLFSALLHRNDEKVLDCHDSAVAESRNDDNLPINNSSICGGSFVFLNFFGRETRLMVCECPKNFKSAKNAPKDELPHDSQNSILFLYIRIFQPYKFYDFVFFA